MWIWERIYYLLGARLLCYMGGMYIAQKNIISVVKRRLDGIKHSNLMILGILLMLALVLVVLDKGILIVFYTFPVFVGFNCLKKNAKFSKVMLMLGKFRCCWKQMVWRQEKTISLKDGMMPRKMQLSFRLKKMNKVPSRLKSVQLDITSIWSYNTSKWT